MEKALDVSNYSGVFNDAVVKGWQEHGYSHLICGTQRREITRPQLMVASTGGMTIDAYVYLYWRYDPVSQVEEALETISGLPVQRLWLDCEDAVAGRSPEEIVALIEAASQACRDFPHGIYTGRWWWQPSTDDSHRFSHLPLWHAEYSSGPEDLPNFDDFRAYGGWSRPAMWQFQGTTNLYGIGVDLNLRELEHAPRPSLDDSERWELEVLRASKRFQQALHNGRFALRPVSDQPETVELVKADGAVWQAFEPPCLLVVG